MSFHILIIDDEEVFREVLADMLRDQGYRCSTASCGKKGMELVLKDLPDLILCDIIMPLMNGMDVLKQLAPLQTNVIMITAHATLETAIEALQSGACDYLLKPFKIEELLPKIERICKYQALVNEIKHLRREICRDIDSFRLVGKGKKIEKVRQLISTVAETKTTVLVTGETGTGKELVARSIHNQTSLPGSLFLVVNCAAIPENLLESELFGYARGSFTGANSDKEGILEQAVGGTVFLDEIGEMPLSIQAKILRATENKIVQRLGSTKAIKIDNRFVFATNRNLRQMVEQGTFRKDLYYRICVMEICIPPLRERREDITSLVEHFISQYNKEMKRQVQGIAADVLQSFMLYDWPGNIRELKNAIERAMLFQRQGHLKFEHFPSEIFQVKNLNSAVDNLEQACKVYELAHIQFVLDKVGGESQRSCAPFGNQSLHPLSQTFSTIIFVLQLCIIFSCLATILC